MAGTPPPLRHPPDPRPHPMFALMGTAVMISRSMRWIDRLDQAHAPSSLHAR